ncbi:diguanylate cyclase domain-containing protein [Bacillus xiapuensis]|uniref:Diguanylate cyclase n=1 Tax=Bacillus xiapuensis TaxID=2014075 RepID=A0ABU6N8T9_9BACI|nr:diguanylate cyclase [Bacillus xiapuensis]
MLKDFVSNAALLIASFSIMGQLFKDKPLHLSSPLSVKFYWGISFGILGNILMLYSIHINSTTIADLRHLAIVIAGAFGGGIPAMVASILIGIGRILFFGYNHTSILASAGIIVTGLVCWGISKLKFHATLKAFLMNLMGLFIISIIFSINIDDWGVLTNILAYHYLISLIGGFFSYYLLGYIAKSNAAQQHLKEANKLLNQLSYIDGLTGIANRRYFDQTLENEWIKLAYTNYPLTLIMFDIDYFKKYNDTYGHLEGDHCLQTIANKIKNEIFTHPSYTFCRYGGEEFAVILPFVDTNEGLQIAKKIQKAIQSLKIPHISSKISDIVTLSIGVATISPKSSSNQEELIQMADQSLYLSKTNGRNRISSVNL